MALTDEDLLVEKPNPNIGGVQRIYRFNGGHGLSLVNGPLAHSFSFAWEAAVLDDSGALDYKHRSLTNDVEVFFTDEAANAFIAKAKRVFALLKALRLGEGKEVIQMANQRSIHTSKECRESLDIVTVNRAQCRVCGQVYRRSKNYGKPGWQRRV